MHSLKQRFYSLLRRSEGHTKTDMVYLTSGIFWTTALQVVTMLCSIPLSLAFANLLSPVDYGIFRYVLTVSSVLAAFSLSGLPSALTRAVSRGYDGSLFKAFSLDLRWSGFIVAGAFICALYYGLHGNMLLAGSMVLVGLFSPILGIADLFTSFLTGKLLQRVNTIYSIQRTIIHTVVIFGTLVLYPKPLAVLFAFFAIQAITSLYYYYKTVRTFVSTESVDPEMMHLGKHLSILNVVAVLTDQLDSLLLFQYIGAAELAIYAFAEMVPDVLNRFTKSIATLAFPRYAAHGDASGIWVRTFLISAVLLPPALAYLFFAPFLFSLFLPAYISAVPFTQALALLAVFNAALPSAYIDARGAIKSRYVINIVTNSVKIVTIGGGILLYGIWGAIIGRFISRFVTIAANYIALRRLPAVSSGK